MEEMNETMDELDRLRKTLARSQEGRDMRRRLFEDCNKKQGEKIEGLSQEYKERSEQLGIAKAEQLLPAVNLPLGQSPMELLTPHDLSQTTEVQVRTIADPSDTLGYPVNERMMR